jgi:dTDP-4-amino-4,6-dideoxygalactose transaminase
VTRVPFQRPRPAGLDAVGVYFARSQAAGWFTRGPCVAELGRRAGALAGAGGHGVPTSSATAGLMLALRALAGPADRGRYVALPSFTCAAMAGAVEWSGFSPLFVDVDADAWHLEPAALEAAIAANPVAAVLASATFGTPPPVEQARAWEAVTAAAGVPLIFDAAAGLGAAAPLGAVTAYSFEATKPAGFGEGGLLVTRDPALADELRRLANYGLRDGVVSDAVGFNAKLSELGAAAGLAAMDGVAANVAARRERGAALRAAVRDLDVAFQRGVETSAWDAAHVLLPTPALRAAAVAAASSLDVEIRTLWDPPLHLQPAWRGTASALPVTERVAGRSLALPMAADLDASELERVAQVLRHALGG